jgi:hypothetical protein
MRPTSGWGATAIESGFTVSGLRRHLLQAQPERSQIMRETKYNSQALAAFMARKAEIDTILDRLTALNSDHFSRAPDRVTGGDVGTLASYVTGLHEISDAAFHEGEHAG